MWFNKWFNEDYLKLYSHRSMEEAFDQVHALAKLLDLKKSASILDLACGTGRHSIAFAEMGYSVVGVDLSSILISKARKRAKKSKPLQVEFIVQNMFDLSDLGQFDLIVNLFTSFGYFDSDEKNASIFDVVSKHLKPNGYFILDYLHPFQVVSTLIPKEIRIIDQEHVLITRKVEEGSVIKTISFPGRDYQERVKLYNREQIEIMMAKKGLSVVSVFNDYQGNPWKEKGDRQLFICKRKGE